MSVEASARPEQREGDGEKQGFQRFAPSPALIDVKKPLRQKKSRLTGVA